MADFPLAYSLPVQVAAKAANSEDARSWAEHYDRLNRNADLFNNDELPELVENPSESDSDGELEGLMSGAEGVDGEGAAAMAASDVSTEDQPTAQVMGAAALGSVATPEGQLEATNGQRIGANVEEVVEVVELLEQLQIECPWLDAPDWLHTCTPEQVQAYFDSDGADVPDGVPVYAPDAPVCAPEAPVCAPEVQACAPDDVKDVGAAGAAADVGGLSTLPVEMLCEKDPDLVVALRNDQAEKRALVAALRTSHCAAAATNVAAAPFCPYHLAVQSASELTRPAAETSASLGDANHVNAKSAVQCPKCQASFPTPLALRNHTAGCTGHIAPQAPLGQSAFAIELELLAARREADDARKREEDHQENTDLLNKALQKENMALQWELDAAEKRNMALRLKAVAQKEKEEAHRRMEASRQRNVQTETPMSPAQASEWCCTVCTFENASTNEACEMCGAQCPTPAPGMWRCEQCTLENNASETACDACGRPKPGKI